VYPIQFQSHLAHLDFLKDKFWSKNEKQWQ
jgi:hypothetical protein